MNKSCYCFFFISQNNRKMVLSSFVVKSLVYTCLTTMTGNNKAKVRRVGGCMYEYFGVDRANFVLYKVHGKFLNSSIQKLKVIRMFLCIYKQGFLLIINQFHKRLQHRTLTIVIY